MYRQEKNNSYLRNILLYLFFLNIFAFMVKIQFFLIVAKNVVANIVLFPTPPHTFDYALVASLSFLFVNNLTFQ